MIDLVQQGLGPVARLPHGLFLFDANFLEPPALVDLFDGGGEQFEKFGAAGSLTTYSSAPARSAASAVRASESPVT